MAGDHTKEAVYAALGGQRAVEGAAYPQAVALLTRALDLAEADPSLPVELAPTERLLGEALFASGHLEEGARGWSAPSGIWVGRCRPCQRRARR